MSIILKVKEGLEPIKKNAGDSGIDIRASGKITIIPANGGIKIVPTEIYVEYMSSDLEIQVRSRSGLAAKYGVFVLNSPGTVDSGYRGQIKVILCNMGETDFIVEEGDRIAQLVPQTVPAVNIQLKSKTNEITTLTDGIKERKTGGFGSTGSK